VRVREMTSGAGRRRVARGLLVAGLATVPAVAVPVAASATPPVVSPDIVIAAGFGGGGNSGPSAYFARDFVELFNRGTGDVTLTNYSLQYAPPSTGTAAWTVNIPTVTLHAGQYYLFEGYASGQVTAAGTLPTPDLSVTGPTYDIKRDSWTVYLVSKQTAISGDTDPAIKDELGVGPSLGTTPKYAAGNPAGAVSNVTAALRNGNGCTDTDNNATDFSIVTTDANFPLHTTSSALAPCTTAGSDLPEAPAAGLLAVAGLAVAGATTVVIRRRRSTRA
jgi:hypothetical protein